MTSTDTTQYLYSYDSGDLIRIATAQEIALSDEAAAKDSGAGVILVDGNRVYTDA